MRYESARDKMGSISASRRDFSSFAGAAPRARRCQWGCLISRRRIFSVHSPNATHRFRIDRDTLKGIVDDSVRNIRSIVTLRPGPIQRLPPSTAGVVYVSPCTWLAPMADLKNAGSAARRSCASGITYVKGGLV